jgi:AraC family transcriptional regulator, regulatory protein of adaptative response / methylated-DNA-[protein]-cysteine methyltransferase
MTNLHPQTRHDADDRRWSAVRDRDTSADGAFYFAVESTGVVCRPGCPARTPLRENVRFFDRLADALSAGYRPCRRCRPDQPSVAERHRSAVSAACREIQNAELAPALDDLAGRAGLSPAHFHRIFKRIVGVTPKQYAIAVRDNRLRHTLAGSQSVTRAMYDAGFGSSGTFYSSATGSLGMSPGTYRDLGAGITITFAIAHASIGMVLVAATDRGICMISLGDSPDELEAACRSHFRKATVVEGDDRFEAVVRAVVETIDRLGPEPFPLPLDVQGTAFQHNVWSALRRIPAGSTMTYREVAETIGSPKAARAVARACATNDVAVAIPCHRVVRADGDEGGYRWGIERKRALLERERDALTGD